ncbi:MAG TPA: hypothetical protein VEQ60_04955 [Longimicrobium sp.]|nr:hypothetical protein [Longimicrobium sp.]
MLTVLRVVGVALILFGFYAAIVYGAAARRILRHAGVRYRGWDRGTDAILRFCAFAGEARGPWRGPVLRGARRSLLAGVLAWFAGAALLVGSVLIEIL